MLMMCMRRSVHPLPLYEKMNNILCLRSISFGIQCICERLLIVHQCSAAIKQSLSLWCWVGRNSCLDLLPESAYSC